MKKFNFHLVRYSDLISYFPWDDEHRHPQYEVVERWELPPMPFADLSDAEEWLVTNFPNYCIGYSIGEVDDYGCIVRGGDFCCDMQLSDYMHALNTTDRSEAYEGARKRHLNNISYRKAHK